MTLVVFPEGGQQPSTSGHQCRTGGNRMASSGSASKPEMYSRAVQTGYPPASDEVNLNICICGQAAEGNCWCESLGFLKDLEPCRVVLQKGCPRSRFAFLLSMHEEFCKTARGDAIINTRRRGSAHGDIRVRRSKPAPPPTLPRPRAQSVIVQNTRAANRLNQANNQRNPQVSAVKPKTSVDPSCPEKQDRKGKWAKVQSAKDQQHKKEEKCLENDPTSSDTASQEKSSTEEGSQLDQNSYVSKAWLLFTGCEKRKKSRDEGSKPKTSCEKHHDKESSSNSSSSVSVVGRLHKPADHPAGELEIDQKKDNDNRSRITGLSVSSKKKVTSKSGSAILTKSTNDTVKLLQKKKPDNTPQESLGPCENDVLQRLGKNDFSEECDRTGLLASVSISSDEKGMVVSGACHLDSQELNKFEEPSSFCHVPSPPEEARLPLIDSDVKESHNGSDLIGRELNERLKDNISPDHSLAMSPGNRASCRDSGIGDDMSVCELRLSSTHSVIEEDQSETGAEMKNCQTRESPSVASCFIHVCPQDDCNIPSEETKSVQITNSSLLEVALESPCSESTLQVEDNSLLGACAIVKCDQTECSELDLSTTLTEEGLCLGASSCEDQTVPGDSQSPATVRSENLSCISSVIVVECKDTQLISEQSLPTLDAKPYEDVTLKQDVHSEAHIEVNDDQSLVSMPEMDVDRVAKLQAIDLNKIKNDKIVRTKVRRKTDKDQTNERKHQRVMNPAKVGMLKYLICQSPLILSELNESDFEDSDSESEDSSWNSEDRFATLPVEIVLKIFRELNTRDLAQLKCTCRNFAWLIKRYNVVGLDSKWVELDSYRNDPCMQCGKVRDRRGDVSLCYWHPKYYYGTGAGRHLWTCCHKTSKDAPGCMEGLHDNNWTTSKVMKRSIPRQWSCNMWHLCPHKDVLDP